MAWIWKCIKERNLTFFIDSVVERPRLPKNMAKCDVKLTKNRHFLDPFWTRVRPTGPTLYFGSSANLTEICWMLKAYLWLLNGFSTALKSSWVWGRPPMRLTSLLRLAFTTFMASRSRRLRLSPIGVRIGTTLWAASGRTPIWRIFLSFRSHGGNVLVVTLKPQVRVYVTVGGRSQSIETRRNEILTNLH